MSLPIVVVFERHWDTIPKLVIKDLLPELDKKGYETLCFECPQNLSSAEILHRHSWGLEEDSRVEKQAEKLLEKVGLTMKLSQMSFSVLAEMLRLYVSSTKYRVVAEKVKQLPASHILKEVFDEAAKLSISVKGIDIESEHFDKMTSVDILMRMGGISSKEDYRITTIFRNLLKIRTEQEKGIVFVCGALHAKKLIDAFKKENLQDEVLYYFPHSSKRYEESVDDISELAMNDTLMDHTHLLSKKEVKGFRDRIIQDITEKTKYTREILDSNSHAEFLSGCFQTNFRAFLRPGYHVDALVDFDDALDVEGIQKRVTEVGVQTHNISLNDRRFLVIPNVNTTEIAVRIRKIRF